MKKDYIKMLTDILTKEGAFGELKAKIKQVAVQNKKTANKP